jgi:hypothetical protein
VQVGAVKIYVAALEALRKKERQDETQFTTKIDGFLSFTPFFKIYVAALEALRKKERQDETQFTTKIDGFLSFTPFFNVHVLFCRFFFNLTLYMSKLRVQVLCLSYFTNNSIIKERF